MKHAWLAVFLCLGVVSGARGDVIISGLSHTDFHAREGLSGVFLDFSQRVECSASESTGRIHRRRERATAASSLNRV
jgi:hypothetical protein